MNTNKIEDAKDTAMKLDKIRIRCPEDYYYLKGWIHCLLQKEEKEERVITHLDNQQKHVASV